VLGAGGYLGGEIVRFFYGRPGFRVVGVCRQATAQPACDEVVLRDAFVGDLRDLLTAKERIVLINAAFDFATVGRGAAEVKYRSLESALREIVSRPGCVSINISSMSAFSGCRSEYGREKLFVESLFARYRGINVRPGLIVSWQRPGSAFLQLLDIIRQFPVVPVMSAVNAGFFVCDLDILLTGIERIIGMALHKSHTVSFCYATRIRLADLFRIIQVRLQKTRILIPIPWRLVYWLVVTKERVVGRAKIRADSIIDFAFPASVAPRRQLYAALVRQKHHLERSLANTGVALDEFFSLEASPMDDLVGKH